MKVADLGVDPRITAILKEQCIEDLYQRQELAAPIALDGALGPPDRELREALEHVERVFETASI